MRRSLAALMLFAGISVSFAQDSSAVKSDTACAHTWAMQFGIGQNFTLGAFRGAMLGMERRVDDSHSRRIQLVLSGDLGSDNSDQSPYHDTLKSMNESSGNSQSARITYIYMFYIPSNSDFRPYYGVGPSAEISRTHNEHSSNSSSPHSWTRSQWEGTEWALGAGAMGCMGVEWKATKNLEIFAEYSAIASYRYISRTVESTSESYAIVSWQPAPIATKDHSTEDYKRSSFSLGGGGVNFGITVHF